MALSNNMPSSRDQFASAPRPQWLDAAPIISYSLDATLDFAPTYISPTIARRYRTPPVSAKADWSGIIHSEDEEAFLKGFASLQESGRQVREYRLLDHDGGWRWIQEELTLVRDEEPGADCILGVLADITDRVVEAHATEEMFVDFTAAASDWLWETDTEHRFTAVYGGNSANRAHWAQNGVGKTRLELRVPETGDEAKWRTHMADLEARRPFRDLQYGLKTGTDEVRHITVSGKPVWSADGEFVGYRGTGRDVTELVEAERRALTAQTQLAIAVDGLAETFMLFDRDERFVLANKAWMEHNALIADMIEPGTPFEDILRAQMQAGIYPDEIGREDTWIQQRLAFHRSPESSFDMPRSGGVHLLMRDQRLPDGSVVTIGTDITELKRSEERFRSLLQSAPDAMVIVNDAGRITDVNRMTEALSGYARGELIGNSVEMLVPEQFRSLHHGHQKSYLASPSARPMGRSQSLHILTKSGDEIPVEISLNIISTQEGVLVAAGVRDISERKRAQEALRESQRRFQILIERSRQGILVHRYGEIQFANQSFAEMLGYQTPEEIVALGSVEHWLPDDERARIKGYAEARLKGQTPPNRYEFRVIRKDGSLAWLENQSVALDWEGGRAILGEFADVTARKDAQAALRESEQLYRSIIDNMQDTYYRADNVGKITMVSPSITSLLGYSVDEFIDINTLDLYVDQSDYETFRRALRESNGEIRDHRTIIRHKDGTAVPVSTNIRYHANADGKVIGVEGTVRDMTERTKAEEALRRSDARFRNLLADASVGISIRQGEKIVYANQALADIFGHARPEAILELDPIEEFVFEEDREKLRLIRTNREKGDSVPDPFAYRGMKEDGSAVWVEQTVQEIWWDGSIAYLSFISDISWRRTLEEQVQRSREKLEERVQQRTEALRAEVIERQQAEQSAETANRAKSEFLSSMSHELRTPLNAVLGFAQLLKSYPDQPLTEGQEANVDFILKGGEHLLTLVNEVLDLSRIETGKMTLSLESVDPADIITESISLIRPMAHQRGITITDVTAPDANTRILADRLRLKQILVNLLSNAVKYNIEKGSVTLTTALTSHGKFRINIADTGLGIPLEKRQEIFQPFARLRMESEAVEGTGIGLAICKQLIEMMDGRIGLDSKIDVGSTFWFELPTLS
jgi:PAS domain S-box-containing protein